MKKIFEYSYSYWFSETGKIYIYEDGSLYKYTMPLRLFREDENLDAYRDKLIFKAPEMVNEITEVIHKYESLLEKLPEHFNNQNILDGAMEEISFGKWKFEGNNIINAEEVSDMTFVTINSVDEYFRGSFYSAEIQKVFREVRKIIDFYNKTDVWLWKFDELPVFPDQYTEEIDCYFPQDILEPKIYRIGDTLPFSEYGSNGIRLTGIKQIITCFFADFSTGPKSSLSAELKKGHFTEFDYKFGKKKVPVLLRIEDIDESLITLRICGIRKDFLKRK